MVEKRHGITCTIVRMKWDPPVHVQSKNSFWLSIFISAPDKLHLSFQCPEKRLDSAGRIPYAWDSLHNDGTHWSFVYASSFLFTRRFRGTKANNKIVWELCTQFSPKWEGISFSGTIIAIQTSLELSAKYGKGETCWCPLQFPLKNTKCTCLCFS